MPQPVHLQYNSPMNIYSREAAAKEFTEQVGDVADRTPVPLPADSKHFDPSKSLTLRAIQEQENDSGFGRNFFDKVAQAEAPNVPPHREPAWTEYAREKSQRARSKTPGEDRNPISSTAIPLPPPGGAAIPLGPPPSNAASFSISAPSAAPRERSARATSVPAYYDSYSRFKNIPVNSNVVPERGYELGGLDFTKGLSVERLPPGTYYETTRKETRKERPGYQFGGTDYDTGYSSAGSTTYRGHGPDPPRLRPRYAADPRAPINAYAAPNVDAVDPHLLVGDTLANQKVQHDTRHYNPHEFGTSFANTTGFRRDHRRVLRGPSPPQPVSFCSEDVYAKRGERPRSRSASVPPRQYYSSTLPREGEKQVTVETLLDDSALIPRGREHTPYWASHSQEKHERWQSRGDPRQNRLETYTLEPNWSRNIQQRKNAWENRAFDHDARLRVPARDRVAPDPAPHWSRNAAHTHNVWQSAADRQGGSNYNTDHYYSDATYRSSQEPRETSRSYYQSSGTNAASHLNTGLNTNQIDYLVENKDKYKAGGHLGAPQQYSTSTTTKTFSVPHYSSGAVAPFSVSPRNYSTQNYSSSTTHNYSNPPPSQNYSNDNFASQNYSYSSSYSSKKNTTTTTNAPITNTQHYSYSQQSVPSYTPAPALTQHSSSTTRREVSQPLALTSPGSRQYSSSYQAKYSSNREETSQVSPRPVALYEENRDYKKDYRKTTTETRTVPSTTSVLRHDGRNEYFSTQPFDRQAEMAETLPWGSVSNAQLNAAGGYKDREGHDVSYKRDIQTSIDPTREQQLLKEEERRVVETPLEPGVISRHVTTKYYKKKTVTDTKTTVQE